MRENYLYDITKVGDVDLHKNCRGESQALLSKDRLYSSPSVTTKAFVTVVLFARAEMLLPIIQNEQNS